MPPRDLFAQPQQAAPRDLFAAPITPSAVRPVPATAASASPMSDFLMPPGAEGYVPPAPKPPVTWQEPGAIVPIQFNSEGGARPAVPRLITSVIDAVMAPGKAWNGEYDERAVNPETGEVAPFDTRMVDDAANLASMVTPVTPGARAALPAAKPVNTVDSLKADASALYEAAEASGVTFGGPRVSTLVNDITAKVMSEGIDPTLHPRATAALKRLQDVSSTGMTVKEVQTMRRILAASGNNVMNPDEGRIAGFMVDALDDMTASAAPQLAEARSLYSSAKKGQLVEETIAKARDQADVNYSAAGFEQALRRNFMNLAGNKSAMRGFTAEEQAAIRKVAEGGPIENFMRYVGKWSAGGPVSAVASFGGPAAVVGGLTGDATLGSMAGLATLGLGGGARKLATDATLNNARLAAASALGNGPVGSPISFLENLIPKAETTLLEQNFGASPLQTLAQAKFRLST